MFRPDSNTLVELLMRIQSTIPSPPSLIFFIKFFPYRKSNRPSRHPTSALPHLNMGQSMPSHGPRIRALPPSRHALAPNNRERQSRHISIRYPLLSSCYPRSALILTFIPFVLRRRQGETARRARRLGNDRDGRTDVGD